jgi:hypothetical protein
MMIRWNWQRPSQANKGAAPDPLAGNAVFCGTFEIHWTCYTPNGATFTGAVQHTVKLAGTCLLKRSRLGEFGAIPLRLNPGDEPSRIVETAISTLELDGKPVEADVSARAFFDFHRQWHLEFEIRGAKSLARVQVRGDSIGSEGVMPTTINTANLEAGTVTVGGSPFDWYVEGTVSGEIQDAP